MVTNDLDAERKTQLSGSMKAIMKRALPLNAKYNALYLPSDRRKSDKEDCQDTLLEVEYAHSCIRSSEGDGHDLTAVGIPIQCPLDSEADQVLYKDR